MKPSDRVAVSTHLCLPSRSRSDFLVTLFSAFDSNQVRYFVLHFSWESLGEELPNELDLEFHPDDIQKLPLVFRVLSARNYRPVQCFHNLVNTFCFVFFWFEGLKPNFVSLTCWLRRPGSAISRQGQRCNLLVEKRGQPITKETANELFRENWKRIGVEPCTSADGSKTPNKTRFQPWLTSLIRNRLKLARSLLAESLRSIQRWCQPSGLFVVLLGPDGVGKSTIAPQIIRLCGPAFRQHRAFHGRPNLFGRRRNSGKTVTEPHKKPVRGTLKSVAYLLAYFLDYWLGFLLIIRPMLTRSALVVFDRYFHDVLVDPRRYRYGGPMWLARLLAHCVPTPDLIFVLDARQGVILSRKCEVPPQEVWRQREHYQQLARDFQNAHLVKTDRSLESTLAESFEIIMGHLVRRFQRRRPSWRGSFTAEEPHAYETFT
jgi:thymidylate kinase